ncbi:MAG TPA: hypothetical protein VMO47_17090 [Rhodothermales bacterium]|nr:hypothetical protein [Rhodothermales bacterium]
MKYRFLGGSALKVSELCFGVMTFGEERACARITCLSAVAAVGLLICAGYSYGQSVHIHKHDATVWSTQQTLSGHFEDAGPSGVLYVDTATIEFVAAPDSFEVTFDIGAGLHLVYACGETGQEPVCSDTLRLTLGFDPKPEVYAWAAVGDATVFLHARILDDAGPRRAFSPGGNVMRTQCRWIWRMRVTASHPSYSRSTSPTESTILT